MLAILEAPTVGTRGCRASGEEGSPETLNFCGL